MPVGEKRSRSPTRPPIPEGAAAAVTWGPLNEDAFAEAFGRSARPVQRAAMEWIAQQPVDAPLVVEAPTGAGKTNLGIACIHASGRQRGVYVCATRELQVQLAMDARGWPLYANQKHAVVCLFGKENYVCSARLSQAMRPRSARNELLRAGAGGGRLTSTEVAVLDVVWPANKELSFDVDGFMSACARRRVNAGALWARLSDWSLEEARVLDALHQHDPDADDAILPRRLFERLCRVHGAPEQRLWDAVSATSACGCYKEAHRACRHLPDCTEQMLKMLTCRFARLRVLSRFASLFVINMSLFFTYRKIQRVIDWKTDYVVLDEAHQMAQYSTPLQEDYLPLPLRMEEIERVVEKYAPVGVELVPPALWEGVRAAFAGLRVDALVYDSQPLARAFAAIRFTLSPRATREVFRACDALRQSLDGIAEGLRRFEEARAGQRDEEAQRIREATVEALADDLLEAPAPIGAAVTERARAWFAAWSGGGAAAAPSRTEVHEALEAVAASFVEADPRRAEVAAAARRAANGASHLLVEAGAAALRDFHRFHRTLYDAREASSLDTWTATTHRFVVPVADARESGITFYPTNSMVSDVLGRSLADFRGLFMSATLTDSKGSFETFFAQTGLSPSIATLRLGEVFDRSRVRICAPDMPKYDARTQSDGRFLAAQASRIAAALAAVPPGKSVLIVSPSRSEYSALMRAPAVRKACLVGGFAPIDFSHVHAFRAFAADAGQRAVVFGSDGLTTGVDLPGRIGLVVITRSLNGSTPVKLLGDHERCVLRVGADELWTMYWYRRDQRVAQAAGRLQRCPDDAGTVLVLGEPRHERNSAAERLRARWRKDEPVERVL